MAEHSTPTPMMQTADTANRPLLAASHSWSPAAFASDADFVLGYESAHPWALGEDDDHTAH